MADTFEQHISRSLDRHLSVTANAGSGKTRVLVNRYADILLNETDPGNIVAITFTRKAAAEMKSRAVKLLEKEARKEISQERRKLLKKIRERLTATRISTIHSFCSQLLREHPVEAGIDPNFSEMSEADNIRFLRDSITSVLVEWLRDEEGGRRNKILKIIDKTGRFALEKRIEKILKESEDFAKIEQVYENGYETAGDLCDGIISGLALPNIMQAAEIFRSYLAIADPEQVGAKSKEKVIDGKPLIENFIKSVLQEEEPDLKQISEMIKEIQETKLLTQTYKISSYCIPKDFKDSFSDANENLTAYLSDAMKLLGAYEYEDYDEELFELSRQILKIAADVKKTVEDKKAYESVLDFNDLMVKADKLLDDRKVRDQIRDRIDFILVDEFQDTNQLQYDIIRKLVPDLSGEDGEMNFFIVGDPKQSIYGFRNADVRVFINATNDIQKINDRKIAENKLSKRIAAPGGNTQAEPPQSAGKIELTATFRLQPVISAFVNKVCRPLFNNKKSSYDVDYSDLVCARHSADLKDIGDKIELNESGYPLQKLNGEYEGNFGSVTFLLSNTKNNDTDDNNPGNTDNNQRESELLAKYIKYILSPGNEIIIDDDGELRPARYGDIAVLARSRNGLDSLVEALQNHNIPYILHAGAGFYEAQEVIDMISFLRFIQNPGDDIALGGLLHSPYFGLPDSELFRISAERGGITFWEKFQSYCRNGKKNLSEVTFRAYELLEHIIHIAPRMTIPQLIMHILEECAWYGAIAGYPAEKQMKANIDKLIDKAREFEFRGFRSLLDFVNEIEMLMEEGSGESEAVFMAGENAINILTIHASKGLEFPIVALFRSGSDSGMNAAEYLSNQLGLTFKMPVETGIKGVTTDVETPLHSANKMLRKFAEEAEEKRILYVALTRAKDHLIISGSIKNNNPGHYLKSIMTAAGIYSDVLESEESEFLQEIRENLEFREGDNKFYKNMIFPVKIYTNLPDIELSKSEPIEMPDKELRLNEISSSINNINFSATKLTRYEKDFEKYFKRYRLGLPETSPDEAFKKHETEADEQISAATQGTVIHGAMENIRQWADSSGEIDQEKLHSALNALTEKLKLSISEEKKSEMMKECADTVKTGLLRRYGGKLNDAQFERQLSMPAGEDFLYAAIDLLIQNDSGEFEVWDWKTNRLASRSEIDLTASDYELQLKIYAYMVSLLYPQQNQVITRLLFTKLAEPGADDPAWTYYRVFTKDELTEFGKELPELIKIIKNRTYHLKI